MTDKISAIRRDYSYKSFSEKDTASEPVKQFSTWWKEAVSAEIDEVNAMMLCTASQDGTPAGRIVLLKDFDEKGFVFYTNYKSFKGIQLQENPKACLVFFWKELERQVRITGIVEKISAAESDAYFHSRPEASQIGAWSSPQSTVIESREELDENFDKLRLEFQEKKIERPAHWGGYRVKPVIFEFWQGRPSRMHDRIQYTLDENGSWKIERLAP